MKEIVAATLLSLLLVLGYYKNEVVGEQDFDTWSKNNGKHYQGEERLYRQNVYQNNKKYIEFHNANSTQPYQLGENEFMALTKEEFIQLYLNKNDWKTNDLTIIYIDSSKNGLQSVDWRDYSTVKTQGSCASGWAFSVTNSMEAWYYIRGGKNISVSTQQFIDCSSNSSGCSGGRNYNAMDFAQQQGVVSINSYPYIGQDQACKYQNGTYKINNYTFVGGSSSVLQSALQNYPVSVGVDASEWQFYTKGLFQNCNSSVTNHYALAVGFDANNNWIVQNSFGSGWGESGYITLYPNNTCGILNEAYQIF